MSENKISFTPPVEEASNTQLNNIVNVEKTSSGQPTEGRITKEIGTGQNAKDSLVWITITYSFYIGSAICLALYARAYLVHCETNESLIEQIKSTWAIFIPMITLALGYIFGKGG